MLRDTLGEHPRLLIVAPRLAQEDLGARHNVHIASC